jgi:hypothetical protein
MNESSQINNPIPPEWENYVTQSPIALEVIQDTIYDTKTYTSASTTSLTFFVQSIASVNKDITNLTQPAMLPNPESFLVQCPRIFVKWAMNALAATVAAQVANDITLLFNTAVLTMKFGNKTYGPYPAWMLSAGGGPDIRLTSNSATAAVNMTSYAQLGGPLWAMFPHMMISPMQAFQAIMEWPSGAVTLGAGNPAISLVYEGQRARAVN